MGFLYMELIQGDSLIHDRWDSLGDFDKKSICGDLRDIIASPWEIEQDPPPGPFIGMCICIWMEILYLHTR